MNAQVCLFWNIMSEALLPQGLKLPQVPKYHIMPRMLLYLIKFALYNVICMCHRRLLAINARGIWHGVSARIAQLNGERNQMRHTNQKHIRIKVGDVKYS